VADGVLDRLVAQIALDGARIDTVIRQFVAAAMPQHVRVDLSVKTRRAGHALMPEAPCRALGHSFFSDSPLWG
jgi:hypothetical protein